MNLILPMRISFNDTCKTLGLSRQGLYELMKRDPLLASCAIKDGKSKQSQVFFNYALLQKWVNSTTDTSLDV
ncbi:transcriptional regulator [Acinetobacter baumannii]|uniref:transcriptional regulator n=1 Tax=Acinetobacter baumannii TaxID=470 RepID=UPI002710B3D3|nr:transcriptional regulator [Acinetobacter baumannii]MDO7420143.1 transcriptional regulator [Acinetobacter baumannii]MDV4329994.1 transcriptional regulator [Acinetobacter baumannii]MDV4333452.1 transcriptional regulator [Acinetobacter baumannii]HCA5044347.1 transcriptional regulator [Acinetobacter baumannii]